MEDRNCVQILMLCKSAQVRDEIFSRLEELELRNLRLSYLPVLGFYLDSRGFDEIFCIDFNIEHICQKVIFHLPSLKKLQKFGLRYFRD